MPDEVKPLPPKPKKGFSNPALRMIGIPRISLPSRNWMIFWSVLVGIGSSIAYDKYEQKQIRKKWMAEVANLGLEIYSNDKIPRKLTIYIAPPPNDFLEESLKIFRKFIKPVLNSGTVDYEIFTESRQGDIRSNVAQRIRDLRIKELEKTKTEETSKTEEPEYVSRSKLYSPTDLLGLYKVIPKEIKIKSDDSNEDIAGGVICIGRGAYKEYLSGLHEGLLGPLQKPKEVEEEEKKREEQKIKDKEENPNIEDEDEEFNLKPVPLKYISTKDYELAPLAPEFNMDVIQKDETGVPYFFEQPVYAYPIPAIQGFKNIPRKIYRYFTKRFLAEDYSERTNHIVNKETRPFVYKDVLMAKEEELDWPKNWVKKGTERGSEWVQELGYDDRVISRLKVFDDKK
ncbi:TIM54 [Candida pseudojiufengensis]|uniref:TIM54 n=1 Tax=Candida pseudojiufengensis TaxID=497109 RepID=UPI002224414B|nr:TIM54 [Candida pseudojiufengensis]KAI5959946.1 TIM54 [Candida pseudojiufengensis]